MRLLSVFVVVIALGATIDADADEPVKVTVLVRGADSEQAVEVLTKALKAVKGIKFEADDVTVGEKPRWFSEPFVVELSPENYIGELAKAVSEASTPNRRERPPLLNLVLYTGVGIDERAVTDLRDRLREVNGVEPVVSGGLGGLPDEGYYWLQLEDKGGAELQHVVDAVKTADLDLSLVADGPLLK